MPSDKPAFFDYIKKAFFHHWNLLWFGASVVLGMVIGGNAGLGIWCLAGSVELAYLAYVSNSPKFRRAIDAQFYQQNQPKRELPTSSARANRLPTPQRASQDSSLMTKLSTDSRRRFEELKNHCLKLMAIEPVSPGGMSEENRRMQMDGLNKLLFSYLKLLFSKDSLTRFFEQIDESDIRASINQTEQKIKALEKETSPATEKMRKTLTEILATARMRMDNYVRTRENAQLLDLDILRVEEKIQSITEMAINRQDSTFITAEVDAITSSMESTEKTISDLHLVSGLDDEIETQTPDLLAT